MITRLETCCKIYADLDKYKKNGFERNLTETLKLSLLQIMEENVLSEINIEVNELKKKIESVIMEVQEEIDSKPQHPNLGKAGCIKRLRKILGD